MAKIFPAEATKSALHGFMPALKATPRAASELNGSIVAARNAEKKSARKLTIKLVKTRQYL